MSEPEDSAEKAKERYHYLCMLYNEEEYYSNDDHVVTFQSAEDDEAEPYWDGTVVAPMAVWPTKPGSTPNTSTTQ